MPLEANPPLQQAESAPRTVRLSDRLLAEAVSAWEKIAPDQINDERADELARRADGDFEHRLIVRARSLAIAPALESAIRHVHHAIGLLIFAAVALVMVAGAAAARAALGASRDEPVNFFWALGTVLGLQTLILLLWIGLMIASRFVGSNALSIGSLGGIILRLGQQIAGRLHKGPEHAAAIAATGAVYLRGKAGKWTASAISNGLWLSFNIGCLIAMVLLLSTRTYTFAWETTILSRNQYIPLTKAIAALPRMVGFATPVDEQIIESERKGLMEARQPWSSLLVGSIVMYGFGPRLLLLGLCLGQRRAALVNYRLDAARPEYLRLQPRLMPHAQSLGVIDADIDQESPAPGAVRSFDGAKAQSNRPAGMPAIVGFEITAPRGQSPWPPAVHGVRWLDLGFVDTRDDQLRVLGQLAASPTEPTILAIIGALSTTPDRGVATFLTELRRAISRPLALVLTGGHMLRQRDDGSQLERRIDDWRNLAVETGIDPGQVIEIDLDHLTQASASNLATLIGPDWTKPDTAQRHIEQAFAAIIQHVSNWEATNKPPGTAELAELHREIARIYQHAQSSWRDLLAAPKSLGANVAGQLRTSADRVVELLPSRLRRSPKWLAAGAAAGALGCVAAASVISPVAIAALPMWSAIGAAFGALVQPSGKRNPAAAATEPADFADEIRSAALFAILLELQGRGENAITRILDEIIDDDHQIITSAQAARLWLDQLRHRLDLAVARVAIQ